MQQASVEPADDVEALRSSPIHSLEPIIDEPMWVDIDKIQIDPTNPGSQTESLRYKRRAPSIRDSYDILGRIIYPVVVCQRMDDPSRFIHVDGFGRLEELRARGEKQVKAIVYPPLTLEQRICLRQTLNAAQEPFDVVSIIRDLQELARERGLDVRNSEQVKTLVRDMPDKVRKRIKDLEALARWDASAVQSMGESYGTPSDAIGMDKLRQLTGILDAVGACHPKVLEKAGGEMGLSTKLAGMYLSGKFSQGSRSQEAIRKVKKALLNMPNDDPLVVKFFDDELDHNVLLPFAEKTQQAENVVKGCEQFAGLLLRVDVKSLTQAERSALRRTLAVLQEVLS